MLCLKVLLKDAQKAKKELLSKGLLDERYAISKDSRHIYFPVKRKFETEHRHECEFCEKDLPGRDEKVSLKDSLGKKLTEKEMEFLGRSMDVIGSIAILEIPEELKSREKVIAEELLRIHKNIKTVLRKGKHEGVFRTQKLAWLAGEDTKETIHKENNVSLKLDVEKVYFSPRLANDRKRVMNLVKKGEEVMVMFSGCAPYVCAIAKNSPARFVYGVEINPEGHRYGLENLRLNKINNAFLVNEDAGKTLKDFYHRELGLKSSPDPKQLKNRLVRNPVIVELHTEAVDFDTDFDKLKRTIAELQRLGKQVVVHQPIRVDGKYYDLTGNNANSGHYQKLISLTKEFGVELVVHACHNNGASEEAIVKNTKTFERYYDRILFENVINDNFAQKESIIRIIKATGLKKICVDTCHLLYFYKREEVTAVVKELQEHAVTYFHLNDYQDKVHGSRLYEGSEIDVEEILKLVNIGVIEVSSGDEVEAKNMMSSWDYIGRFQKRFDRILMPLPKSADDFLPAALAASKKGTIIHFYDFQREDETDKSVEKIKKACESAKMKFKVLDIVKCGQQSPRVFRICVDFEIV
jgi:tRNA (guanine37-N1)-methyltransferase